MARADASPNRSRSTTSSTTVPENCLDVIVDSKARAMLVWREEQEVPVTVSRLGLGVVKSVDECLGILSKVDAANQARPGLVDRMIRRLGFREPARV